MARAFLFYNPLAGCGELPQQLEALEFVLDDPCIYCDMTKPETYESMLFSMEPEDYLVVCGGDGTLHRFVNLMEGVPIPNEIRYFPAGRNNNFARGLHHRYEDNPFPVTALLRELPQVTLKRRTLRFLTAVALDQPEAGRRCDSLPGTSPGMRRYAYPKTLSLTVRTNGRETRYDRVKMAFVQRAPGCSEGALTALICHGCSRAVARRLQRRLQKGIAISDHAHVTVLTGQDMYLAWNHPVTLTVDGEPFPEVTAFHLFQKKEKDQ